MEVKLLSKLGCGEKGKVVRIRGTAAIHRYLFESGLFIGRMISIEKTSLTSLGDPIEVRVNSSVLTLEKEVAANIQIEVAK
jgi:Fe2+ transport system protein FeoA